MHHRYFFSGLALLLLFSLAGSSVSGVELDEGFKNPPLRARTRCFWWWLNGNVTKEAITHDLEEMKAKGYGGALIFDADGSNHRGNESVSAGPMFGTPQWTDLYVHAVREAARLGLELSLSIQSGWNLGGPDVTPEEAAKQLTWSQTTVTGGGIVDKRLTTPQQRDGFYRDIAVLAYPVKPAPAVAKVPDIVSSSAQDEFPPDRAIDGDPATFWVSGSEDVGDGPTEDAPEWLELTFPESVSVGAMEVEGRPGYGPRECELHYEKSESAFEEVAELSLEKGTPGSVSFETVTARRFRLMLLGACDPRSPDAPRNVQISEWRLMNPEGKSLIPVASRPIAQLQEKASFREIGGSAPDCRPLLEAITPLPGEEDASLSDVVNLSDHMDADGRLQWSAPEGEWVVLRFGYTVTDARVSTASGDWQGRVVDYMSTPVLEAYWERHVKPLLDAVGPLAGRTLKYLHTDSWECGGMNWTPTFPEAFERRRGYDPIAYLPIIAGKIVENRDVSNRFLADFRKTISDCVADDHYRVFAEMTHARGLEIHPESGGPHAGPFDGIKNMGLNDMPMSEFWVYSPHRPKPENRFFVKQASSAAHIYGKRFVGAEAFTSIGPHWSDILWQSAKPSFNHEACAGLNLCFIHTFTCSPQEMGLPGQEYFAGTHFNPQVTWWDMAGAFISYLNRCQFMLQDGQFVADVCYYYGDHVPNIARRKEADPAGALPGYDYDVIDEPTLLNRLRVEDRLLRLPSGMQYRVLVLPDHRILSLGAVEKVYELVQAGATVLGPKTNRTASLVSYPESEERVRQVADTLWGGAEEAFGIRNVGKGRVAWGMAARDLLAHDGVLPDCRWNAGDDALGYIHRRAEERDIYFVSNRAEEPVEVTCTFRVTGKQPELWDPMTGAIRDVLVFEQHGDSTSVPLGFSPYGALFVVFRKPIGEDVKGEGKGNFVIVKQLKELEGPWTVSFDPTSGGPESVVFDKLVSWTERHEDGIRFYSGTATYSKTFIRPEAVPETSGLFLDLGDLRHMASVRVNGQEAGIVWAPPFRVDITPFVRDGENTLEIDVVNNWPNRLIGDAGLPPEKRLTWTNITKFEPDTPLEPSGLLGPVRIAYTN
ncbi:MAG: glycosyl hydrolase [Candidatus Hydrogenedentes bacterium]|nr:glycosyl hydrolase [Candidatus Hydrogenedentota bacterium]